MGCQQDAGSADIAGLIRLSEATGGVSSATRIDFGKGGGLVPVVVRDAVSGETLMLAYANQEALEKTVETGFAHFYSRSRRKLWLKGEESGNKIRVLAVTADCDLDALEYLGVPAGPVCHTGRRSCFHNAYWSRAEEEAARLLARSLEQSKLEGGTLEGPLTTGNPPPDPLLLGLASKLLVLRHENPKADAALVDPQLGLHAGLVLAQSLRLPAYLGLSSTPRDAKKVLAGGFYDRRALEAHSAARAELAVFLLAEKKTLEEASNAGLAVRTLGVLDLGARPPLLDSAGLKISVDIGGSRTKH